MATSIRIDQKTTKTTELVDAKALREGILAAAKEAQDAGRHDELTVSFPTGKYCFTETLNLSAKENPELLSLDITFKGTPAGTANLTSLVQVDGFSLTLAPHGKYYTAQLAADEKGNYPRFREFFMKFHRLQVAKSPIFYNHDPLTPEERSGEVKREGLYCPYDIAEKLASDELGATELVMYIEWVYAIFHVDSVDLTKTRTINGEKYALIKFKGDEMDRFCRGCSGILNIGEREMFFQNAPAFIETNTYAYDWNTGKVYIDPEDRDYIPYHYYEHPTLEVLVNLEGLDNVTFDGISFTGTATKYACDHLIYTGQANNIKIFEGEENVTHMGRLLSGALLAKDVRGLTVKNCTFRDLGGYGVQIIDRSLRTKIEGCSFDYVSMSAISVGNPTANWCDEQNRTYNLRIENNHFKHIAYEYPACPCIYVAQVDGLKLLRNTVHGCGYSSVSVGWNWDPVGYELGEQINIRDAEIAYNYFHNYMDLLKDGGAVYVLGSNCNRHSRADRFNRMHDNVAMVDELSLNYGKYGYYCDGSASNWDVSHSVVINTLGMPIFSQPHPNALSYHNSFTDIYSNTQRHVSTHVPSRDVITTDYHLNEGDAEALLAAYPEAVKIRDAAGCDLVV